MKTIIYTLSDGENIRYVGKTSREQIRYNQHIRESKLCRTHKEKWINSILSNNKKIIMEILDECDENNANELEIFWIQVFKSWGFNLVNQTNGGEGSGTSLVGRKLSEETKLKMSESAKKRKINIGGWNKGLKMSSEFSKKISITSTGRKHSEETKNKISIKLKERVPKKHNEITKNKISQSKKGKSSWMKGKKHTEVSKMMMSKSKKGIKKSEDFKQKISNSQKINWVIETPSGDILNFFGYNSFIKYVLDNKLNVSVSTLKIYGKNKGWKIIKKY
jgi:hypothetical protein